MVPDAAQPGVSRRVTAAHFYDARVRDTNPPRIFAPAAVPQLRTKSQRLSLSEPLCSLGQVLPEGMSAAGGLGSWQRPGDAGGRGGWRGRGAGWSVRAQPGWNTRGAWARGGRRDGGGQGGAGLEPAAWDRAGGGGGGGGDA